MNEESRALVPIEEKTVEFYDDEIVAVAVEEQGQRRIYVPMRPISEYLGLDWSAQYRRIQRDPILSEEVKGVAITTTPSSTGVGGGAQEALCLPVEMVHGWLFGISVSRVREELREKILRYQRDCYRVLWEAFEREAIVPSQPETFSALAQVRAIGVALQQLAEEQMQIELRVSTTEGRLDRAAAIVRELGQRVASLERRVSPTTLVTDEQAGEIAAQVRALAQLLTERDPAKNHFAGVYSELYRRFGVSSYKNVREDRYEEVLAFLEDWRARIVGA